MRVFKTMTRVILLVLSASAAMAVDAPTLRLDRQKATLVDSVRLEVSIAGTRQGDAAPIITGLEPFTVSRGGTASRVQIVNGQMDATVTHTFFLQPKQTGTFTIGPAQVEIDGRSLSSNRVTLTVTAPSPTTGKRRDPVFIESELSADNIFTAEQVFFTLKLHHRVHIGDLRLGLPTIDHITFKQLGQPRDYQTKIGGVDYGVVEIRYVLTAARAGVYSVGPARMSMTVRRRKRRSSLDGLFDSPLFGNPFSSRDDRHLTVVTQPPALTVRPLPIKDQPADFSGVVGRFEMQSTLTPNRLPAGESATLTVRVSGRGNVNRLPDIELPDTPFARVYGDQPVLETQDDANGSGGSKTMKWALVPNKAGRFTLPQLRLSYFDPTTERYQTLQTALHTLTVLPGTSQSAAAAPAPPGAAAKAPQGGKQQIEQLGRDILPIHMSADNLTVPFRSLSTGWFFWPALLGPPAIYVILLGGIRLRRQTPERRAQARSKRAYKSLVRACRGNTTECTALLETFRVYLNDRLNLSIGTLTPDEAQTILLAHGVTAATAQKAGAIIQQLETAAYAGQATAPAETAEDLLALAGILEKELR